MKLPLKHTFAAMLGGMMLAASSAHATITFTAGEGDWTFFYDSSADRFDVVFRQKGNTQATGLTNPYPGPAGQVGAGDDFTYDTLVVSVTNPGTATVGGIDYLITSAEGGLYENGDQPDLGVRRRFRELEDSSDPNSAQLNQFGSFRLTLDWANSTKPAGSEFALFDGSNLIYETANGSLTHDWNVWGHDHWHWGFTDPGDYQLVFTMQGIGGMHGDTAVQSTSLNFTVVPEPSAALLSLLAAGLFGLRRRRA